MTPSEQLEFVEQWAYLYNTDLERFFYELYAPEPDFVVYSMGRKEHRDRKEHLEIEETVLREYAPKRLTRVDHVHACGADVMTVECVLLDEDRGPDWSLPYCSVLTLNDSNLVVIDRTYADFSTWPGADRPDGPTPAHA